MVENQYRKKRDHLRSGYLKRHNHSIFFGCIDRFSRFLYIIFHKNHYFSLYRFDFDHSISFFLSYIMDDSIQQHRINYQVAIDNLRRQYDKQPLTVMYVKKRRRKDSEKEIIVRRGHQLQETVYIEMYIFF